MKLALVLFLATAGTIGVHSVPINNDPSLLSSGLEKDLNDFLALVPKEKIEEIVLEYIANDADFQSTLDYIVSKDFTSLVVEIESMPDVKMFLKYLHDSGLDVYTLLNKIHDFLGLDHMTPMITYGAYKITGGLPGLIKDIENVLPLEKIQALYEEKLKSSPEFADLIKRLQSSEFQNIVNTAFKNPKLQDLINRAKAKGVDVKAILDLVTKILGIKFPGLATRSITLGIQQDIDDFLALIPTQKIQDLVLEYLATDSDFQATMDYILSDEFRSLVRDIEAIPEVRMFIKYLNDVGLDVYNVLKIVHDFLGIDQYVPFAHNYGLMRITGGLPGLIKDIEAILPIHEIQELYEEKLKTSKAFRALVEQLKSEKSQKIIDIVWTNEKFIKLISRAEAKGVNVKAILQLITDILGIKFPHSRQTRSVTFGLNEDLQDFLALVPMKEIEDLVMEYLASDADFQEAVEYMMSDDFKKLVQDIEAIPEVKVFIKYLNDAGLDVYALLNKIHDFLGLGHITPEVDTWFDYDLYKITGGLPGLIEDVKAMLPVDKIEALYKQKLESSPEFAALIKQISSPEFQKIVDTVWANPKLQELISRAQAKGVDVKAILQLITEILGIHFPSGYFSSTLDLKQDLEDFLALVPMKEIEDLVMEYLASDADFQEAMEYMMSDDFKKLVQEIEGIQEVKVFIKYLNDAGLDVYTLLNKIHDFLGLDHMTPEVDTWFNYDLYKITGGLPGLIEDVKAMLPVDKIEALYKQKLESSPEFAALIKRISSPEFQKIVDTVWANPKLQELISKAQSKGVDVKAILQLITEILGIHFPSGVFYSSTMNLNEDLQDFLALVPMKKIEDLVMEYLASDADFQEAVEYMMSDDFKKLVLDIEAIEEVKVFIKYLNDAGLDVYALLNKIHDFLGLDHITPDVDTWFDYDLYKITGGLPGLIEDVKAILPVDKIEALYKQKLESSPEFAALIKRISSPEFQKIVDTVWANPKLQELISRAQAKGVDVKAILQLITEILGIHFPSGRRINKRSTTMGLNQDLQDFLALVPMKQIEDLVMEYLASDADFQEAMEYMMSDDFKKLIQEIESIQEVKVFIKYLNDAGLDVYTLLNQIHDFLGLDHMTPMITYGAYKITGGLPGLINDIKAILPVDKIEALYKQKLQSSPEFADLIKRLSSPEFQKIVNTVWANPKLQELIKRALAKGVDVKAILELITEILGIHFPERPTRYTPPALVRYEGNLKDDLNDLMDLIPMNDVLEVALEYVAVDEDFQVFLEYLLSDYFGGLITDIENIPGVSEFLEYLHKSGLDVYTLLNKLHAIWNLDPISPPSISSIRNFIKITGGLPGFINDIIAVLPVEKIEKLYNYKLEKSEALKDLLQRIGSPEFQKMVDILMANERLNDLMTKAEEKGVDVNAILRAISQLLGIKLPSRPRSSVFVNEALMNDLRDFVKLVPNGKIAKIVIRYAIADKDFQRVMKYMRSSDFHTLIRDVEATQEMKQFLEYLNNIGLDVYRWIKIFHKIIGMKETEDEFYSTSRKISGGINGLINDIKEVLPVEELSALYAKKLEDSPEFAEFVERLRSQELQNLINALAKIAEVQRVLSTLETMGVDVNSIFQILSDFFGITFPPRPFFENS